MATIASNIQRVQSRIRQACTDSQRDVTSVHLLAVSKTFGPDAVRAAHAAGLHAFGENYVQEAIEKIASLADLRERLEWHFIGSLQSNKTRVVAEQFDWVHTIDRIRIAQRLSEQRPQTRPPLNVCIEVNVSAEPSKGGVVPAEVEPLARQVVALPGLRLRGLMTIPAPLAAGAEPREAHAPFRALRELFDDLRAKLPQASGLDTLSMGMSADLEIAIAEGANLVRIGTAIFGTRT